MSDAVIGSSYLKVIPKLDAKTLEASSATAGNAAGLEFGKLFSKAAKALVALGVGKAILDLGKASLSAYSDFEQLSGGIQKIFDEMDYDSIAADADRAYAEMGMSANEYMSAMTDVGATLAASLGDQRGYDAAREGLMAISDYASGTGKSMDELTDKFTLITRSTSSYQSIADQFSGILPATSSGFLEAAQAAGYLGDSYKSLTEVPVDEYQEAVTHMLSDGVEQLGLAGNTAAEAADTYAGSLAAMQSAFEDWKVALAGGGDLPAQTEKLVETVTNYLSNLIPRVGEIARGMLATIPLLLRRVPGMLRKGLTNLPDAVRSIFGDAVADGLVAFMKPLLGLRRQVASAFAAVRGALSGALDAVRGIMGGIGEAVGDGSWAEAVGDAVGWLSERFEAMRAAVVPAVEGMAERIQGHLADMQPTIEDVKGALGRFAEAFAYLFDQAAPVIAEIAGNLVSAAVGLAPIIGSVVTVVVDLASAIMATLGGAIQFVTWAFQEGVPEAVEFLSQKWEELKQATVDMATSLMGRWTEVKDQVTTTVDGIRAAISSKFDAIKTAIADKVGAIKKNVTDKFGEVKKAITQPIEDAKDAVSKAIQNIKDAFNTTISFPHINLPHFRITGGESPWGLGGLGKAPSIGIDWYAEGGVIDGARLIGVGEQGAEMVWPSYEPYLSKYAQAIAADMPAQDDLLGEVRSLRDDVRNLKVYLDTGALVGGISRQMDGSLGRRQMMAGRGVV